MEIEGTWSDLLYDHDQEKKENEEKLESIRNSVFQAVSVNELDNLFDDGMAHLEVMVASFQNFYENQIQIIKTLPLQTEEFFLVRLQPFLDVFGLTSVHAACNW